MMKDFSKEELLDTINVITSFITRCEKMDGKFKEGTSQHTLLQNRLQALYVSKQLVENKLYNGSSKAYSKEILSKVLPPVISIISKSKKAQEKYDINTSQYLRFEKIISPMNIARTLILAEQDKLKE